MGMRYITKYEVDLGNCLALESVDELNNFIQNHKREIGLKFVDQWEKSEQIVKEITLRKMICNRKTTVLPYAVKQRARYWLKEQGYSTSLGEFSK